METIRSILLRRRQGMEDLFSRVQGGRRMAASQRKGIHSRLGRMMLLITGNSFLFSFLNKYFITRVAAQRPTPVAVPE